MGYCIFHKCPNSDYGHIGFSGLMKVSQWSDLHICMTVIMGELDLKKQQRKQLYQTIPGDIYNTNDSQTKLPMSHVTVITLCIIALSGGIKLLP